MASTRTTMSLCVLRSAFIECFSLSDISECVLADPVPETVDWDRPTWAWTLCGPHRSVCVWTRGTRARTSTRGSNDGATMVYHT